jgi:hypothetical protein
VNVTRYALGVVVSTTCLVTGVLWYDRARPEIRAEDVAACIAAGVERKWVTDWIPSTNTVTSTIKASDLVQAAALLRAAITNTDVIYLDAGTWADGGLDMAYGLAYSNLCYEITTNTYDHFRTIQLKTPESVLVNGIAIADRNMPITVFTNSVSYEVHTNLVIVSQTNTYPDWVSYGRTNGTVFEWTIDPYYGECYKEAGMPDENYPIYLSYDDQWVTYTAYELWQPPAGSPVGTYVSPGGWSTGSVEIAWHNVVITTNVTTTTIGGTNMPLYTALGTPSNIPSWTNLLGGVNSWWEYAGFGALPYILQDVETISGRGRHTIETKNLTQIRSLATNMFRTVDFDFAATGTVRVLSGTTWQTNDYWAAGIDQDAAYAALPSLLVYSVSTSAVSGLLGMCAKEDSRILTFQSADPLSPVTQGTVFSFTNKQLVVRSATIPDSAFSNAFISRLRVYVAAETKSPYTYVDLISGSYAYRQAVFGENDQQDYGSGLTFGGYCKPPLPFESPYSITSGNDVVIGYLTTNFTWSLVLDVANPATNPVITIGPDALIDSSYFSTTPPQTYYDLVYPLGTTLYERKCETRITHSALVIDWNFKLFGSTPYTPIETNRPAWMP